MAAANACCRLCLDPFGDNFTTIENLVLREQMKTVFRFSVNSKQELCSSVCQSCSYTISEFYKYSERVRLNQDVLNGKATITESDIDCKPSVDVIVSHEPVEQFSEKNKDPKELNTSPCGDNLELKIEVSDEIIKFSDAKGCGEPTLDYIKSENSDENPSEKSTDKPTEPFQELLDEDRLGSEHFATVCDICNAPISSFNLLHRHFQEKHNRRRTYIVCCNKKYSKKSTILDHINYHFKLDAFRCKVCCKKYDGRYALSKHMQAAHSSENYRPYKCDRCPKTFKEEADLDTHKEQHKNIQCPQCDKFFCSAGSLKTHKINYHGKDRTKVCDVCGRKFKSKEGFQQHMNQEHMGIAVERLQCHICHRSLKGRKNLLNHLKVVHGNKERELECDKCLHKFAAMSDLRSHIFIVHQEAKHECKICGKMFKRALNLKEHRATHTGEVLYKCEFCDLATKCRANMYKHIKRKHAAEMDKKQTNISAQEEKNMPA